MTPTATSTGLFDALTNDELLALSRALITRREIATGVHRFSANRMAAMLGQLHGADDAYHTYRDIAREIGQLHAQVLDLFAARIEKTYGA